MAGLSSPSSGSLRNEREGGAAGDLLVGVGSGANGMSTGGSEVLAGVWSLSSSPVTMVASLSSSSSVSLLYLKEISVSAFSYKDSCLPLYFQLRLLCSFKLSFSLSLLPPSPSPSPSPSPLSHLLFPAASSLPDEVRRREQSEPQQTEDTLCPSVPRRKEGDRHTFWGMVKLS